MSKRKKILFLASWYPSKVHPTLGNFIQKHAELANDVADVCVLYAVSSQDVSELQIEDKIINGVRTCIVYYPKAKHSIPFVSSVLKLKSYLNAIEKGYRHLDLHFDLMHLNEIFPAGLFALKLHRKFRLKLITSVHWSGFLSVENYTTLPFYQRRIIRKVFGQSVLNLPVSKSLSESLKEMNLISNDDVFPNVVDENIFYPSEKKKNRIRFLHISTFDAEVKNTDGLLEAFSRLKIDFELHIVTEGAKEIVWKDIRRHGIDLDKCFVDSSLSSIEISEAMRKADCFVLFSWKETFSVTIAESMMSGLPIISSKCGGLTDRIDKETGRTVKPGDVSALRYELENFDRESYSSEKIRMFALQFSKKELREQLKEIYETIG